MATFQEIRDRINLILQDPLYENDLDSYIKEGIRRCASAVLLPSLESVGDVDTVPGAVEVVIPTSWNFDRNLYAVDSTEQEDGVKIFSSQALMLREYPQFRVKLEAGDVTAVTIVNSSLVYYKTPAIADTLVCAFYQKPDVTADPITCLPDFLQLKLLSSFVCMEIFDLIEDGIDGVKVNTQKHATTFFATLEELELFYKVGRSRPEPNRNTMWL